MKPLILIACFFPLALIWIIMKLSLWISAVNEEQKYVAGEKYRVRTGYVENAYKDTDPENEDDGYW
jgi:hypothetical protein